MADEKMSVELQANYRRIFTGLGIQDDSTTEFTTDLVDILNRMHLNEILERELAEKTEELKKKSSACAYYVDAIHKSKKCVQELEDKLNVHDSLIAAMENMLIHILMEEESFAQDCKKPRNKAKKARSVHRMWKTIENLGRKSKRRIHLAADDLIKSA